MRRLPLLGGLNSLPIIGGGSIPLLRGLVGSLLSLGCMAPGSVINPAWVEAPYCFNFLICFDHPRGFKTWSRKRRLKWLRRWRKQQRAPKIERPYRETDYMGEMEWIWKKNRG